MKFEYNEKMVEETARFLNSMVDGERGFSNSIDDWYNDDADNQDYWRIKAKRLLNHLGKCC